MKIKIDFGKKDKYSLTKILEKCILSLLKGNENKKETYNCIGLLLHELIIYQEENLFLRSEISKELEGKINKKGANYDKFI